MKKMESLLRTASMKLEFSNLEIRFYKPQVSFLVIKTVKCKRGNKDIILVHIGLEGASTNFVVI